MDRTMVTAAASEVTLQPEGHLDYKVYLNNEAECDKDKADRPGESGERTLNALKKGDVIYVVLANTSYEPGSRVKYKVTMTPVP